MAQDVAYDLWICPEIDLARGVTVPEQMTADGNNRANTSKSDVLAYPFLQSATCERPEWYSSNQEDLASCRSSWSTSLHVCADSTCYLRQKRKLDPDTGLRSTYT